MDQLATIVATSVASAVEIVEVITILLAVGLTRGWRSTLIGAGAALLVLLAITVLLGSALTYWIDLHLMQMIVGALLLVFGLQWLRKAVLRSAGLKALNDEEENFRKETGAARAAGAVHWASLDWFAFTVAFKGVLLEGLEVVFIVITIGAATGQLGVAAFSALGAALLVGALGAILHRPLSAVPQNTLKYSVGLLLATFGTYWAGEGVGIEWAGQLWALAWILGVYLIASLVAVRCLMIPSKPPHKAFVR